MGLKPMLIIPGLVPNGIILGLVLIASILGLVSTPPAPPLFPEFPYVS